MTRICEIRAREVLDSRGNPTVEVDVCCRDGATGRAIVPSGASTGTAEAHELRDGDQHRFGGRGVLHAVAHVNEVIAPRLLDMDPAEQFEIDRLLRDLDGSPQKSRLGANAVLGVSLASAHAAAEAGGLPLYRHFAGLLQKLSPADGPNPFETIEPRLPVPMTNMISGGLHAGGNLDFQDFMIIPAGAPNYATGLEWIMRVYRRLGELLADAGYVPQLVADEGGYGPRLASIVTQ